MSVVPEPGERVKIQADLRKPVMLVTRALIWRVGRLRRQQLVFVPVLELHRVEPGAGGLRHHVRGPIQVTVVVYPDLRHERQGPAAHA